jgi:hypothetical protein
MDPIEKGKPLSPKSPKKDRQGNKGEDQYSATDIKNVQGVRNMLAAIASQVPQNVPQPYEQADEKANKAGYCEIPGIDYSCNFLGNRVGAAGPIGHMGIPRINGLFECGCALFHKKSSLSRKKFLISNCAERSGSPLNTLQ